MVVANFEDIARAVTAADVDAAKREQSSILFPYLDLDVGIEVSRAVYNRSGHGPCELHELAAEMKQVVSGAFRLKTGTARIFGLTSKEGRSGIQLSELGQQILSPETERAARAEAFLQVPLYAAVYEKYKGQRLPPAKALEREMLSLGVSSKQTDKARQAFERSARQSGFFEAGDDRLVRPKAELPISEDKKAGERRDNNDRGGRNDGNAGGGSDDDGDKGMDPLFAALVKRLPPTGSSWNMDGRLGWLRAAITILDLVYDGSDGTISVKLDKPATGQ